MAKRTLEVPDVYRKYTDEELLHFLRRGKYDVEYRRGRNQSLTALRQELKELQARVTRKAVVRKTASDQEPTPEAGE